MSQMSNGAIARTAFESSVTAPAMEADPPHLWFENYYFCRRCNLEWIDEWDCMCDDECPDCGTPHTPYHSRDVSA
ncbi:hypothetical protein [Thioalkalivibrio sp. ALE16]|uniref:hypothetical protein n=1 Tax=Thioalkalivibrio sp. ALE16 TaxID=1158172 RepID=UPI00037893FB|nr:hypothetical protein [Thioalkalivibrio sp. ALE16]